MSRGDRVDIVDRRKPLFSELLFGEAADDAHPLRRRRDRDLTLQHIHRIGKRAHPVPAQLHVVVQAATNDVGVVVIETRQHALAFEVDDLGVGSGKRDDLPVLSDRQELAVLDGDSRRVRIRTVERCQQTVVEDEVGAHWLVS